MVSLVQDAVVKYSPQYSVAVPTDDYEDDVLILCYRTGDPSKKAIVQFLALFIATGESPESKPEEPVDEK